MRYVVRSGDKWLDVAWFFDKHPSAWEMVRESWKSEKPYNIGELSVLDLCQIFEHGYPLRLAEGVTVKEFVKMCTAIELGMQSFAEFLKDTVPPMTPEQRSAAAGTLDMSLEEAVLLTCKEFYGLHNLEAAQKLTVYEYIIARRSIYNERLVSYNMRRAMSAGRIR